MGQKDCSTERGKYKHITERERYKIEGYLESRLRAKEISLKLGIHISTVYREIKRGTVVRIKTDLRKHKVYRANAAQRDYESRVSNRERSLKIGKDRKLEAYIRHRIEKKRYSPDVITGLIKRESVSFKGKICTKTLYNYIERGVFSGISNANLWEKRKRKKKKYKSVQRISLRNKMSRSIEERPVEINSRLEYGHWEGDCVKGKRSSKESLFVLTERKAREQIILKIKGAVQSEIRRVIDGLERKYGWIFKEKFKSITFDNGGEFLDWESIEKSFLNRRETRTITYYAHPFSSWERGTNENQNRMIRRFIPKGRDIAKISDREIKRIENWMNSYPRKILDYKTPNELVLKLTESRKFLN